ncbi:MAG TPA: helix-turn-helix domain-containing protein, partial [Pyrinomonadaceae bacterium]|nr:helix-turn-helix domain-containing protein [Pyrinomonadaceae bacterium]
MSAVIHLVPGTAVAFDGKRYTIAHILDLDAVLCKEDDTGKTVRLYIKDLTPISVQLDDAGSIDTELAAVSEEDWREANRRFHIIRPILGSARRSKEGVAEQARAAGVHPATLYRWIDAYERGGRTSALLPGKRGYPQGKARLSVEVDAIVKATIEDFYLNKQKRSAQKTYEEVLRRCRHAGIKPPHQNTVRKRIAQLSEDQKLRHR